MSHVPMLRGVVCLAALVSITSNGMQQAVMHDNSEWRVQGRNGQWNQVHSHDIDPMLRRMNPTQLKAFFDAGCGVKVANYSNGDYAVRLFVPGKGGGPVLGCLAALGGTLTTAAAATGTFALGVVTLHPVAGTIAAVGVVKVGMVATVYVTGAAIAAPTP